MAQIIAIVNQKGGVAKTTTTHNLGAALAERGHKVLVVDFTPEAHLSNSLGVVDPEHDVAAVLEERARIGQTIQRRGLLDLLPSSIDLARTEVKLAEEVSREAFLGAALDEVSPTYDYILIDTPGNLGLLTINALAAAHWALAPVQMGYLPMQGLGELGSLITTVGKRVNRKLKLLGALATFYHDRNTLDRQCLAQLRQWGPTFSTTIQAAVKAPESQSQHTSVLEYASASPIAAAYRALAVEVEEVTSDRKQKRV